MVVCFCVVRHHGGRQAVPVRVCSVRVCACVCGRAIAQACASVSAPANVPVC